MGHPIHLPLAARLNISSVELDLPNLPAPLEFKDLHDMAVRTIDEVTPLSATAGKPSFLISLSVFIDFHSF